MKKRRIIRGMIAVLVAIGVAAIWPKAKEIYVMKRQEREMTNLETEVVRIEMAGQLFDIPMRYMYGQAIEKYHQWPKAKKDRVTVDAISISVLLPSLHPYYPEDDAKWADRGHGDRVNVSIMKPVGRSDWYQWLLNQYLTGKVPGNVTRESEKFNLIHFSALDDVYFPVGEPVELTISCDKPKPGLVSPSCKTKSNYGSNIVLEYYYGLEHLPQWREIDDGLKSILDAFAQAAKSE